MKEKIKPKIRLKKIVLISLIIILAGITITIWTNMNDVDKTNINLEKPRRAISPMDKDSTHGIHFYHYELGTNTKLYTPYHGEYMNAQNFKGWANYAKDISGYTFVKAALLKSNGTTTDINTLSDVPTRIFNSKYVLYQNHLYSNI